MVRFAFHWHGPQEEITNLATPFTIRIWLEMEREEDTITLRNLLRADPNQPLLTIDIGLVHQEDDGRHRFEWTPVYGRVHTFLMSFNLASSNFGNNSADRIQNNVGDCVGAFVLRARIWDRNGEELNNLGGRVRVLADTTGRARGAAEAHRTDETNLTWHRVPREEWAQQDSRLVLTAMPNH